MSAKVSKRPVEVKVKPVVTSKPKEVKKECKAKPSKPKRYVKGTLKPATAEPARGDFFKDKAEAVEYYKSHEDNLKDKPDWMIECIIDFAQQYPNYREYCEVEAKMKAGKKLSSKLEKKYGHLKWDKEYTEYKDGEILYENLESHPEGTYDDIARDPVAREKYNKYNLDFGGSQKPDENVKIRVKPDDGSGTYFDCVANQDALNNETGPYDRSKWDVTMNKDGIDTKLETVKE